jgi:hypothetical protein
LEWKKKPINPQNYEDGITGSEPNPEQGEKESGYLHANDDECNGLLSNGRGFFVSLLMINNTLEREPSLL